MGYSSRDGYGTAAVLVGMSSAEDKSVVKRNTYANTDDVALYEVPVLDTTQYEVVLEHTTSANTKAADHCCYEVPVSENDRQYEMVVEHRTENANAVYEGVGFESSIAASSLCYQYVSSNVSPFYIHTAMPIYIYLSVYSEILVFRGHHKKFQLLSVQLI